MSGIEAFASERTRQIELLGYTIEHDADHHFTDLVKAAQCYSAVAAMTETNVWDEQTQEWFTRDEIIEGIIDTIWPWEPHFFKPSTDAMRNLEKAGALLAAAYDNLEGAA